MTSCKEKVNEINARRTEAEGDTRNNMPFGIVHPSPNVMIWTVTWAQLNIQKRLYTSATVGCLFSLLATKFLSLPIYCQMTYLLSSQSVEVYVQGTKFKCTAFVRAGLLYFTLIRCRSNVIHWDDGKFPPISTDKVFICVHRYPLSYRMLGSSHSVFCPCVVNQLPFLTLDWWRFSTTSLPYQPIPDLLKAC